MGIGVSIFLLAVGAILAFAVTVTAEGVNLNTVGVILMIVGAIGLLFSMLFWSSWSPYRRDERVITREREYV
jgi:predicted membrane channel-forming protein YqfA (hemolysin III family)